MFNILLVVLDTLRNDYATIYESILKKNNFHFFNNAVATANWTIPSHASIFSGMYPKEHNAHETRESKNQEVVLRLEGENILLSQILQYIGYETYLITANLFINPLFGFKGFDYIFDISTMPLLNLFSEEELEFKKQIVSLNFLEKYKMYIEKHQMKLFFKTLYSRLATPLYRRFNRRNWPIDKGLRRGRKILKNIFRHNNRINNKFIFLNLMEIHEPYFFDDVLCERGLIENLTKNFTDEKLFKGWEKQYYNQCLYVNENFIKFLIENIDYPFLKNSLIIITSDHGQLLGEHNRIGHTGFLYDELIKVPLFIKLPDKFPYNIIPDDSLISLVNIKRFILNSLKKEKIEFEYLTNDYVFAENYGISINIPEWNLLNKEEKENVEIIDHNRLAVFYKDYKIVINLDDFSIEEEMCYNNSSTEIIPDSIKQDLLNKGKEFLLSK